MDRVSIETMVDRSEERVRILKDRGERYSTAGNVVQNFIDVSTIAKTLNIDVEPSEVAQILVILKMVRNANGRFATEEVESRLDHIDDMHNYIDLAMVSEMWEEDNAEGITAQKEVRKQQEEVEQQSQEEEVEWINTGETGRRAYNEAEPIEIRNLRSQEALHSEEV